MPGAAVLVIACGALAHEINALRQANGWDHMHVQCLPADLHNTPAKIPEAVREKIRASREHYASVFVAYADCGTSGRLDAVLAEEGIERLPGAHCYEFFAGQQAYQALSTAEPGTFYLTDFLVRHFDRLVIRGLGLDRHPELLPTYFGNYTRVVYLAQLGGAQRVQAARAAAERLGLAFEHRSTGYGELVTKLQRVNERLMAWQD